MTTCSGVEASFVPQQALVHTLDPDCPVSIGSGFTTVLSLPVTIPAGLPAYGISIVADLVGVNGVGGVSTTLYRLVDEGPDGTQTVLRVKTILIPDSASEDLFIIGGLNNLAAGVHTFLLQVDASVAPFTVTEAGMLATLYRQTFFAVTEDDACQG